MSHVLSMDEAADMLRLDPEPPDPLFGVLLPAIDGYLESATGHNWAADEAVDPLAKAAAQMLLVQWYENPAMIGSIDGLTYGLTNLLEMLRAKALPDPPVE